MSNNLSKHKGEHALEILQKTLRTSESKRGTLVGIRAEENDGEKFTIGEHDLFADDLPLLHLVILDDNGAGSGPDGTAKTITGTAWIESIKKDVAIFR